MRKENTMVYSKSRITRTSETLNHHLHAATVDPGLLVFTPLPGYTIIIINWSLSVTLLFL